MIAGGRMPATALIKLISSTPVPRGSIPQTLRRCRVKALAKKKAPPKRGSAAGPIGGAGFAAQQLMDDIQRAPNRVACVPGVAAEARHSCAQHDLRSLLWELAFGLDGASGSAGAWHERNIGFLRRSQDRILFPLLPNVRRREYRHARIRMFPFRSGHYGGTMKGRFLRTAAEFKAHQRHVVTRCDACSRQEFLDQDKLITLVGPNFDLYDRYHQLGVDLEPEQRCCRERVVPLKQRCKTIHERCRSLNCT